MKKFTLILVACLALVAAGCGSKKSSTSTATATSAATAPAKTPAANAGVAKVDIKNIQFNPPTITIKQGETVVWTNSDGATAHTVTKTGGPGPKFDSGNLVGGKTYKQQFTTAGTINYVCTIHPGQSGKVVVQ